MREIIINTGAPVSQDTVKAAFDKVNSNFTEVYARNGVYPEDYGYVVGGDQATNDTALQNWLTAIDGGDLLGRTITGQSYVVGTALTATGRFIMQSDGVFIPSASFTGTMMSLTVTGQTRIYNIRFRKTGSNEVNGLKITDGQGLVNLYGEFDSLNTGFTAVNNFEANRVFVTANSCGTAVYFTGEGGGGTSGDECYFNICGVSSEVWFRQDNVTKSTAVVHLACEQGGKDEAAIEISNSSHAVFSGQLRGIDRLLHGGAASVHFNAFQVYGNGDSDGDYLIDFDATGGLILGSLYMSVNSTNKGVWIRSCQDGSALQIFGDGDIGDDFLKLGDAANGKSVTRFTLLEGSVLRASLGTNIINLDNAINCNLNVAAMFRGIVISSTSTLNKLFLNTKNPQITNNRTEKDNLIYINDLLTDAEVTAITSPFNGYRLLGKTQDMTRGEFVYVEGTGWVATRN